LLCPAGGGLLPRDPCSSGLSAIPFRFPHV
jgi:hypothetical protein